MGEESEIQLCHKIHSNQEAILSWEAEKVVWTSLSVLLSSIKNTREAFPPTLTDTMSITSVIVTSFNNGFENLMFILVLESLPCCKKLKILDIDALM